MSSSNCFFDICFNISLHLFVWLISKSISFENSLFSLRSFFNSFATTLIVARGVPRECAAAAARPPKTPTHILLILLLVIYLMLEIFFLFLQKI